MPLSDHALIELLRSRAYAGKTVRLTPETQLRLAAALYAAIGRDRTPAKQHAHAVALGFVVEQVSEDGERIEELVARLRRMWTSVAPLTKRLGGNTRRGGGCDTDTVPTWSPIPDSIGRRNRPKALVGERLAFKLRQLRLGFVLRLRKHIGEEVAAGICCIGAQPTQVPDDPRKDHLLFDLRLRLHR